MRDNLMMFLHQVMIKLFFGLSSIFSIGLLFKIVKIIVYDLDRLTEYGLGYLSGLSVLFIISSAISYKIFKKGILHREEEKRY